ncbi:centromere protein X isoform X2 [Chrysemys picta bellii]|uniref:centromere protein X isoform X2 n=1 Tax=Chrysemys picta bellii TaxID=8478 RepID=UPI00046C10DA|nr:centromere protein X isoform X2 [Chrysemys picta bellii]
MERREESASGFRKETVNKILHLHFKDDKTREAAARSARQAQAEDLDRVDIEHVEKVLPQLAEEVIQCLSLHLGKLHILGHQSKDPPITDGAAFDLELQITNHSISHV